MAKGSMFNQRLQKKKKNQQLLLQNSLCNTFPEEVNHYNAHKAGFPRNEMKNQNFINQDSKNKNFQSISFSDTTGSN